MTSKRVRNFSSNSISRSPDTIFKPMNEAFVEYVNKIQGIYVSVFEHRPRALSEKKEVNAELLDQPLSDDFSIGICQ